MKKSILNLLWWFATPYILCFFLLIIFLDNSPLFDIINYLKLNIILVFIPIVIYWSSGIYLAKDFHKREQISIWIFITVSIYSFLYDIIFLDNWLIIIYLMFVFAIIEFLIISYTKLNQYIQLIASFLVIIVSTMLFINKDFYIWIVVTLILSGVLIFLFIENNIDKPKNILFSYLAGLLASSALFFILQFIVQKSIFELLKKIMLR